MFDQVHKWAHDWVSLRVSGQQVGVVNGEAVLYADVALQPAHGVDELDDRRLSLGDPRDVLISALLEHFSDPLHPQRLSSRPLLITLSRPTLLAILILGWHGHWQRRHVDRRPHVQLQCAVLEQTCDLCHRILVTHEDLVVVAVWRLAQQIDVGLPPAELVDRRPVQLQRDVGPARTTRRLKQCLQALPEVLSDSAFVGWRLQLLAKQPVHVLLEHGPLLGGLLGCGGHSLAAPEGMGSRVHRSQVPPGDLLADPQTQPLQRLIDVLVA
mmetsp:Transcript_13522/g.38978  ORF Transcript_13522/g.38978 Transcript_13522/m.38978 type:complete len:269 (-) Transcript_13522:897-1703(-)